MHANVTRFVDKGWIVFLATLEEDIYVYNE